jgi:hypothetical protein
MSGLLSGLCIIPPTGATGAAIRRRGAPRRNPGLGNRFELPGDLRSFESTNRGIDPAPPAELFTGAGP